MYTSHQILSLLSIFVLGHFLSSAEALPDCKPGKYPVCCYMALGARVCYHWTKDCTDGDVPDCCEHGGSIAYNDWINCDGAPDLDAQTQATPDLPGTTDAAPNTNSEDSNTPGNMASFSNWYDWLKESLVTPSEGPNFGTLFNEPTGE